MISVQCMPFSLYRCFSFLWILEYILASCEDNGVEDELGTEPADTEGQAGEEGDTGAELDDGRVSLCILWATYVNRIVLI